MRYKKGLSLIEVMAALFVLSFAMLSVASIFTSGLEMNRKTKLRIHALEVAAGVTEAIRALSYSSSHAEIDEPTFLDLVEDTPSSFPIGTWTPKVLLNSSGSNPYLEAGSAIFFLEASGADSRIIPIAPTFGSDKAAVRIEPLAVANNLYLYDYDDYGERSRIYRIIVTVFLEEASKGEFHYSYIQMVSYKGDGLSTPDM